MRTVILLLEMVLLNLSLFRSTYSDYLFATVLVLAPFFLLRKAERDGFHYSVAARVKLYGGIAVGVLMLLFRLFANLRM